LNLFIQGLDNKDFFPVNFHENLTKNYIKIISNIYHVNITKSAMKYKTDVIDAKKYENITNAEEIQEKVFNEIYKGFLKETRQEVADFFDVKPHDIHDIPIKVLFRIYPYYLKSNSETKREYAKLTAAVNKIIKLLENRKLVPRFIDSSNEFFSLKPKDIAYDYEKILSEIEAGERGNQRDDDIDERKRILDKYKENYIQDDE